MLQHFYSIYDNNSKDHISIINYPNTPVALRSITHMLKSDKDSVYSQFPTDFSLYHVFSLDLSELSSEVISDKLVDVDINLVCNFSELVSKE